ncbi:MAG: hypothetical protein PWP23_2043 [Candidatus Sumerlaeota bacterium]|nr:hypothetical protein [Candidatus Sumerlaeota bacterium]
MTIRTLFPAAVFAAALFVPSAIPADPLPQLPTDQSQSLDASITVDWTRSIGTVNRALFSTQGFMQIYSHPNPLVLHSFKLTNPTGTQTRLETYIHQMEPENDNDDPNVFEWSRLNDESMIRFIDDRAAFERTTNELGMEPLSLLCYSVDWLRSDNPDDPLSSKAEWAEFAAAVVQSYNGTGTQYRPNLRLAQIWNEPNMPHFYGGTPESYFELFRLTADRLHRDYPGVLVGGPSISRAWHTEPDMWMDRFFEECGPWADYAIFHHYGPQGEGVEVLTNEVKKRAAQFRAIPGKENGQVMITETDAWFDGWPKIQFILERQFRFIDLKDLILGVHQFCCLAYNESGNYTFGIIDEQGGVIEGTFWPYWLFRNYIGQEALALCAGRNASSFDAVASFETRAGDFVATTVIHNRSEKATRSDVTLFFPPSDAARVLVAERLTPASHGVDRVWTVAAGQETGRLPMSFAPGEAVALTLQSVGKRHYTFRDINNQEQPWIAAVADKKQVPLNESVTIEAKLVNTLLDPVSGTLRVANLPAGWTQEVVYGEPEVKSLGTGKQHVVRFRLTAKSLGDAGYAGPYVWLDTDSGKSAGEVDAIAHSIPVSLEVLGPLALQVLPIPVEAIAGETNIVEMQLVNSGVEPVEANVFIDVPEGFTAERKEANVTVAPGQRLRVPFNVSVANDKAPGSYNGTVRVEFLGVSSDEPFGIDINEATAVKGTPLDLTPHLNFDPIAFWTNREDFDQQQMGLFSYPGDFTPSNRIVTLRGVPYRMPDLADGKKCAIEPKGGKIAVPAGKYSGVAMMGFGHDGKHPGTWTFHYTDGTTQAVASQIPEWCSPLPEGPQNFQEAFTAPHRYVPAGVAEPACQLYTWTLATDPSKELAAIELPTMEHAYLFAITLLPKD